MTWFGDFSRKVTLDAGFGRKWTAGLQRKDDGVWLCKGWPEFAKFLGLKVDHLFQFRYENEKRVFHVTAMETRTLQIEYPAAAREESMDDAHDLQEPVLKSTKVDEKEGGRIEDGPSQISSNDEQSLELLTNEKSLCPSSAVQITRTTMEDHAEILSGDHCAYSAKKATRKCFLRQVMARTSADTSWCSPRSKRSRTTPRETKGVENSWTNITKKVETLERRTHHGNGGICYFLSGTVMRDTSSSKALQRAKAFLYSAPVAIVVMQPSYIGSGCSKYIGIPTDFFTSYFNLNCRRATLKIGVSKTWSVEIYVHAGNRKAFLRCGTKQFVLENHLIAADVCAFELDKEVNSLNVIIFRSTMETTEEGNIETEAVKKAMHRVAHPAILL